MAARGYLSWGRVRASGRRLGKIFTEEAENIYVCPGNIFILHSDCPFCTRSQLAVLQDAYLLPDHKSD